MQNTSNIYCRQIAELLQAHGIRTAFCSPGSRNAPLLLALEACEEIEKQIVVDERSAAFQALGCSLVQRSPTALVCTSGTAILDYAPAVAEAYYSGVPLIVLSADRPLEWIDQDDSQTIRQFGILDHIVKGSYDIRAIPEGVGREYTEEMKWMVDRTMNEALLKACAGKPGPVHINVQLADPLGELLDFPLDEKIRYVSEIPSEESLPQSVLKTLSLDALNSKVMLVAGFGTPDNRLDKAVRAFAALPNVVVMAETIANLHDPQPMSTMIDSVLCDMSESEKSEMRPDIVISMGGALVSRMLKQFLRDYPPRQQWSIGHSNYFCDCFKSLTHRIDVSPSSFLKHLYGAICRTKKKIESDYSSRWLDLRRRSRLLSEEFIEASPWTDLKALSFIFRHLKLDNLFVSNGTAVRYSQLLPHVCHAEYCNRGVSGIDGSTSTAIGGAWAYNGKTTFLSGDVSWIYDSGASALGEVPYDMRMIVMDNSGGGIFRFIKSTSRIPKSTLERYFCVEGLPEIVDIAEAYSIETMTAENMEDLRLGIEWLSQDSDFPRLLVVSTPSDESAERLREYFVKNKNKNN